MTRDYSNRIINKIRVLMIVLIVIGNVGCGRNESVEEKLKVHFIDVGQADAILIQQQDQHMLIDGGNNEDGDLIVDYLKKQGVKGLQYIIGTHPHEDHIGGLDEVIHNFHTNKVIMPKVSANTKTFEDVLIAIENKGLKITSPKAGDTYSLGEGQWTILAPNKDEYKDMNNYSIVVRYVFGNTSFLFTGDAEETSESEILSKSMKPARNLQSDVLKVGHHGSESSTSLDFLNAINPRYVVISVGVDNGYGHPHEEVMARIQEKNIEVFRTDEKGTIIISSDGTELSILTEKSQTKIDYNTNESVIITDLNKKEEIVTIKNISDRDIDMTNWTLLSVTGNQKYIFPQGFILKSNDRIRISSGEVEGTLQWSKKNIWNNTESDPAELYDENGNQVYRFED